MNYTTHSLVQGSPEWAAFRATKFGASEAAAVLGLSSYKTRAELLREKATGITPEIDAGTQRRFDDGHAFEAAARVLVEQIIDEELYPATVSADINGLPLSASLDGATMSGELNWEHKTANQALVESLKQSVIPAEYEPQMEQGLLITGAERCLFSASKGTADTLVSVEYRSKPEVREALRAGWKQFADDLANYTPEAPKVEVLGRSPVSLPVLFVQLAGGVQATNLPEFKAAALAVFNDIPTELNTDRDFADAAETVKWCEDIEARLKAAKANAQGQMLTVDELFRTIDDISSVARNTRLNLGKQVDARKEQIRVKVAAEARTAYCAHLSQMNSTLAVPVLESASFVGDVAAAIKGKRSLDSLKADVAQVVANYKIAASNEGNRHHANLAVLGHAGRAELFSDRDALVRSKQPDDLANLVKSRIADADKAEADRLEAQRVKIRAEEEAKAKAAAEALAEQDRQRIRDEEQAKARQEAAEREDDEHRKRLGYNARFYLSAPNDPQPVAPETPAAVAVLDEAKQSPVAAVRPGATMKLGDINARIAPISISGTALAQLGFHPMDVGGTAKVYDANQFEAMCRSLGRVLKAAMEAPAMEKAA